MKKVLSIIILITLIFSLVSCGKKDTSEEAEKPADETETEEAVEEPEETEEAEEAEEEPQVEGTSTGAGSADSESLDANSAAWADAYLNHIYENVGGYNPEYTYDLEDINDDGVPELIMLAPPGEMNAADQIVTFGNGEISQVWDGYLAIIEGEGLVYTVWGRQSSFTERLYTINNGRFEQIDESTGADFTMRASLTEQYGEAALKNFDGTYDYQGIIDKINDLR